MSPSCRDTLFKLSTMVSTFAWLPFLRPTWKAYKDERGMTLFRWIREVLSFNDRKLQHPFSTWMEEQFHQQKTTPPMRIVYDIFMDWAIDMAQKFNVASVMFNPYGAFAISLMQSISSSIMQKMLGKDGEDNLVVNFNLPRPLRLSKHEVCPVSSIQTFQTPFSFLFINVFRRLAKDR